MLRLKTFFLLKGTPVSHLSANKPFVTEGRLHFQAHLSFQHPASFQPCTPFSILQHSTLHWQQSKCSSPFLHGGPEDPLKESFGICPVYVYKQTLLKEGRFYIRVTQN